MKLLNVSTNNAHYLLLMFALFLFFWSCINNESEEECLTSPLIWGNGGPIFHIDSILQEDDICIYQMRVAIYLDSSIEYFGKGFLKVKEAVWFFSLSNSLNGEFEKIVDFSKDIPVVYDWQIDFQDKVKGKQGVRKKCSAFFFHKIGAEKLLAIKIHAGYFFDGEPMNIVLFISSEKGFVGSFLEGVDINGRKIMGGERGEIYPDLIDYSNFRRVKLI